MRSSPLRGLAAILPLVAALLSPGAADAAAVAVPTMEGQAKSHLDLRFVSYEGGTNGTITVEVTNRGQTAETFSAQGLFFVPEGSPNEAPQRLGAVGPFLIKGDEARKTSVLIPPGGKIVARLDVYCIDSHRHSPTSSTKFNLSTTRMPRELTNDISSATQEAAKPYGSVYAPAAKSAVQQEVWKNRDKKWIKLEGEGRQEDAKH